MYSARKGFNFYRSYYEVAKELPKKHRLDFLMAVIEYQFEGKEPNLQGMAKFAFMSQKHSIYKQLEGYKHGLKGGAPLKGSNNPSPKGELNQVQEEEQEQVQGKEEEEYKSLPFSFMKSLIELGVEKQLVTDWLKVRKTKKCTNTETAFKGLVKEFDKSVMPVNEIIKKCCENSWGGFRASWKSNGVEQSKPSFATNRPD